MCSQQRSPRWNVPSRLVLLLWMWLWHNWHLHRVWLGRLIGHTHRLRPMLQPHLMWPRTFLDWHVQQATRMHPHQTQTVFRRQLHSARGHRSLPVIKCLHMRAADHPDEDLEHGTWRAQDRANTGAPTTSRPGLALPATGSSHFQGGRSSQAPTQRHPWGEDDVGTTPNQYHHNRVIGCRDMRPDTHRDQVV